MVKVVARQASRNEHGRFITPYGDHSRTYGTLADVVATLLDIDGVDRMQKIPSDNKFQEFIVI